MPRLLPGFDEAVAQEQWERHSAHLNIPEELCGVRVRQITPLDVCKLHTAKSPFLRGGEIDHADVAQFLFLLWHESNPPFLTKGGIFRNQAARPMTMLDALDVAYNETVETWAKAIDAFLDVTYRQQLSGNSVASDAPIASSVDWLLYRMASEPFRWSDERTYNTPIRVIHQRIRCWQDEKGEVVSNPLSDALKAAWMANLNARIKSGEVKLNEYGYPEEVNRG